MPIQVFPQLFYKIRPHARVNVVMPHTLDKERFGPIRFHHRVEQPLGMIEGYYRIFGSVNEQHGTADGGRKVHIGESISRQGAAALDDDTVDG